MSHIERIHGGKISEGKDIIYQSDRLRRAATTLRDHGLSDSRTYVNRFIAAQQRKQGKISEENPLQLVQPIPHNIGHYVTINLVHGSMETYGIARVQKSFQFEDAAVVSGMKNDLDIHIKDLQRGGVKLAKAYNTRVEPQADGNKLIYEQLYFPFDTAHDWLRQNKQTEAVTNSVINNQVLPLLRYTETEGKRPQKATAAIDNTLKNFLVAPDEDGAINTFYCDLILPRIIDPNTGRMKRYEDPQTGRRLKYDQEGYEFSEVKRFLKDMQLANFVIRNTQYIVDPTLKDGTTPQQRALAAEVFLNTIQQNVELSEFMKLYFGNNVTARQLATLDINVLAGERIAAHAME